MILYRDDHRPGLDEARELYRASTLGERRPVDDDARFAAYCRQAGLPPPQSSEALGIDEIRAAIARR